MDMKALTVLRMISAFSMKLITDPGHIMILLLSMIMEGRAERGRFCNIGEREI